MGEIPFSDSQGDRLTSIVYVMRGRSPFSRLGILDLEAGTLSLREAKGGGQLFAEPAATVQARRAHRKFFETRRPGFEVQAAGRWWFLVPYAIPVRYQRRSTRDLFERYHARELVPRPPGMTEEAYRRLTGDPAGHQALWAGHWVAVLGREG